MALIKSCLDPHKATAPVDEDFATLMQSVSAASYIGKRVSVEAELQTHDATAASIWLRIDDAAGAVLAFDNMMERTSNGALRGSVDWRRRRIVADVPPSAASIHFGVLLHGFGAVRARDFRFGDAEGDLPSTATPLILEQPTNLGFNVA